VSVIPALQRLRQMDCIFKKTKIPPKYGKDMNLKKKFKMC
jgi:hypothetical protein